MTDTAAPTPAVPDPAPTDPYLIAELLRQDLGDTKGEEKLYARVQNAVGTDRIEAVWLAARSIAHQYVTQDAQVRILNESLTAALAAVEQAQRAMMSLTAGEGWPIVSSVGRDAGLVVGVASPMMREYAEGLAGQDILAHLDTAGLALRSALALRPIE